MRAGLAHVELELARGPEHPFGEQGHLYHLYLPLGHDDRVDMTRLRSGDPCYKVRRQRPGEATISGPLRMEPDGRLLFGMNGHPSNREIGFSTPPDRFTVGQAVAIDEEDGETRRFQVIAVRRE